MGTISRITDAVADAVLERQRRPLEEFYPVVYLDAIRADGPRLFTGSPPVRLTSRSGWTPSYSPILRIAPLARAGSASASNAILVARSRSSSGYFFCSTTVVPPCHHCLHQTRDDSP